MSPYRLSDLVQNSVAAFKYSANTKKHLLDLLKTLKVQVLAVADGA